MKDRNSSKFEMLSDRQYDRANKNWICGHSDEGRPCPIGPTKNGQCRSQFECAPARQGDSWVCTRAASIGGKCERGPYPDGACCNPVQQCVPRRSIRNLRYQISISVFALAVGSAAIFLAFPAESQMISPGRLCHHHATTANSCQDCHSVNSKGLVTWVGNAVNRTELVEQSQKCMVCHREIGSDALQPHSLSRNRIRQLSADQDHPKTSSSIWASLAKSTFGPPHTNNDLHCSSCHQEHQGPNHDLASLTNEQCQVCHTNTFHGFESGHPEFDSYPFRRRSRIYFDHVSHYGRHFAGLNQDPEQQVSCIQCHDMDASGSAMQLKGFDAACAKCHEQQITEDLTPGLVVLGIPGLDVESLKQAGLNPGRWPDTNRKHASAGGDIPPLMSALFSGQFDFKTAYEEVQEFDLTNLENEKKEDLDAVHDFVWTLKTALAKRMVGIEKVGRIEGKDPVGDFFDNQIPSAQVSTLVNRWFPNLAKEISARESGTMLEAGEPEQSEDLSTIAKQQMQFTRSILNGWYLQDSDLTLRYRATAHADGFLTKAIELAVQLDATSNQKQGDGNGSLVDQLMKTVASPFVSGRCMKCHTIDRSENSSTVNWLGFRPNQHAKRFTRFSHGPHLTNRSNEECQACHVFDRSNREDSGIFRPEFVDGQGMLTFSKQRFRCDFESIGKQNCSNCHTNNNAGNSCLSCHNYHVR